MYIKIIGGNHMENRLGMELFDLKLELHHCQRQFMEMEIEKEEDLTYQSYLIIRINDLMRQINAINGVIFRGEYLD